MRVYDIASPSNRHIQVDCYYGTSQLSGYKLKLDGRRQSTGYAFFDLVADDTYTDYGFRFRRIGGADGGTYLYHRGTGNLQFQNIEAAPTVFVNNSVESMRITGDGKVGIGTTSPEGTLDVVYSGDSYIRSKSTGNNASVYIDSAASKASYLRFFHDGTASYYIQNVGNDLYFRPGAGEIKTIFKSDGKVGIGTTSPSHLLDLGSTYGTAVGDLAAKKLAVYSGGSFFGLGVSASTLEIHSGSTSTGMPAVVVKTDGKVGIGTTSPSNALHISSTTASQLLIDNQDTANTVNKETSILFKAKDTVGTIKEVFKIENISNSGNWTSSTLKMYLRSNNILYNYMTITGVYNAAPSVALPPVYAKTISTRAVYIDSSGVLGTTSSSERFKENIVDMPSTEWLYNLRPVTFDFKEEVMNEDDRKNHMGLIAEEVVNVKEDLVGYDEAGKLDYVAYERLIPALLKEIQSLNKRVKELEK